MYKNPQQFLLARRLRKKGKSYSEISKNLGIAKSTLSYWFSRTKWSQTVQLKLNEEWKINNSKRLIQMNKRRRAQRIVRYKEYRKEAKKEFRSLKKNPLFLIGISIYWGEGEKAKKGRVAVINSDVNLQTITVNFFRSCLKVPEHKLRVALFIYPDHNPKNSLDFWSKNLKIPQGQFIKTQILSSRSKLAKNKLSNGICNLYFSNTKMHVKILEWIRLLSLEMRE